MTKRLPGLCVLLLLIIPAEGSAACNWQATAAAEVSGGNGTIWSSHFGQLTNVDCVNSRNVVLRANTLVNGGLHSSHDEGGGAAILGAWVRYEIGFWSCSGTWSSTTRFGTRYLGVNFWLESDTSGLTQAYCWDDDPGGGGGGGGPGCGASASETTTWSLTGSGSGQPAEEQLGASLSRLVERPEGRFVMEEWAVVSGRNDSQRVQFGSSRAFSRQVEEKLPRLVDVREGRELSLIVQAVDHPHNHRYMPTPNLHTLEVDVDRKGRERRAESFWIRAEIAPSGEVDRLLLFDSSGKRGDRALREAIQHNLRLDYEDSRRHRAVVFGLVLVAPNGRATVEDAVVALPRCCCGTDEPFCV